MIIIKTSSEIAKLRKANKLTHDALELAGESIKAGMTTRELDRIIQKFFESHGAKSGFLGYGGFPGSACISVNEEVIHGIPGDRVIMEGDIVSVDTGALVDGYYGDSARTFAVGNVSDTAKALMKSTEESLYKAIELVKPGVRLGDIGYAIQKYNEDRGFSVVREFVGHGIGKNMHEEPEVPNYGTQGRGQRLMAGMVIAIEPMIAAGNAAIKVLSDDWTVVTRDSSLAAHYEHSIAVTSDGCVVLSAE